MNDPKDVETLMKLMIMRDGILNQITHGLKVVEDGVRVDLVRELELLVAECALLSSEIALILEPTHEGK